MRAWLHEHNIALEERDFFSDPLTEGELRALLGDRPPADFFSWKSPSAKKLEIAPGTADPDHLVRLMLSEPRLIRRPMVKLGEHLIIGADYPVLEEVLAEGFS